MSDTRNQERLLDKSVPVESRSIAVQKYAKLAGRLCFLAFEAADVRPEDFRSPEQMRRPKVKAARSVIRAVCASDKMIDALTTNKRTYIGGGGETLVSFENNKTVRKEHYTTIGLPTNQLQRLKLNYESRYQAARSQFGDSIEPTEFAIGESSLRGLSGRPLIVSRQRYLADMVDVMSPLGGSILRDPSQTAARRDLTDFVAASQEWAAQDKWIDTLGTANVSFTSIDGEWRLRATDPLPLEPSALEIVHPNTVLSNRQRLESRLFELSTLAGVGSDPYEYAA